MICFYHSADLDGKASAAIVKLAYPDTELYGIDHGQSFPWDKIQGRKVWMVDFSLQSFQDMIRLQKEAKELTWIDHHKTAIDNMKKSGVKFQGIQRNGIGACALVWEYIYPNEKVPYAIQLLAEYDVWNHTNPDTLPFQYGFGLYGDVRLDDSNFWKDVVDEYDSQSKVIHTIGIGKQILNYLRLQNKQIAKTLCFDLDFEGLHFLAANYGPCNAQVFDSLWDEDNYDGILVFSFRKDHWRVSLYTVKENVDLSTIAKKYGGGGHAGACGFTCQKLPFNVSPVV